MAFLTAEKDNRQEKKQQGEHEEQPRIFQVTDGLKSPQTKVTYRVAFGHFLKVTVKNDNLSALLDYKSSPR